MDMRRLILRNSRALVAAVSAAAMAAGLSIFLPVPAAQASVRYGHVVLALRPFAYWRLGEHRGTTAHDSSPHHHSGTYRGKPALGQPGAIKDDPNTSAGFDARDDYMAWVPSFAYHGPFTVVAWIDKTGSTGNVWQTFFDTRTAFAEYSFDFKLSAHRLFVDVGDGKRWFVAGPGIRHKFKLRTWYQVAAVARSTRVTLYVDGKSIGSEAYPRVAREPMLFSRNHPVYLGTNARYGTEWFRGRIDEVAVFLRPLATRQIARLYQAGISS